MRGLPSARASTILIAAFLPACTSPTGVSESGLQGLVLLGPIIGAGCTYDSPCEEPVAETFMVEREGRVVATFESDTRGVYRVSLPTGTYLIRPRQGTSLPIPETRRVTVPRRGTMTQIDLHFSTGIR